MLFENIEAVAFNHIEGALRHFLSFFHIALERTTYRYRVIGAEGVELGCSGAQFCTWQQFFLNLSH